MDHHNSMETYYGLIKTPHDALIIFEACHLGVISRVHRRLSDIERQSVRSGSVYCFDEREAGMRRWTDGKSWSPSRVTGSFLTYRELDDAQANQGGKNIYRPDGLLKQSFSITTSDNQKLHLISYYTNEDVSSERLYETPSRDPRFAHIIVPKGVYPETSAAGSDAHIASAHQSSPSPPTPQRTRHRPHHRAFQHKEAESKAAHHHCRTESTISNPSSLSLKDHRYSPIQTMDGKHAAPRSRSNSHNVPYASQFYGRAPEHRYKSSSPTATSSFPTPPPNVYSPTTSWASDDDQPLVVDTVTLESLVDGVAEDAARVMIPALRDLPFAQRGFAPKMNEPFPSANEQDSLSVLANLAADTLLLPKLEPKEISRERVRWVEDDRQLRALSSMLRL